MTIIRQLLVALACCLGSLTSAVASAGPAVPPLVAGRAVDGGVVLATPAGLSDIVVDPDDHRVVALAAGLLADDVERVTGRKPAVKHGPAGASRHAVFVGTIGHSKVIDGLVASGKLNVEDVRGQWESFVIQTVDDPAPGVERALVIAGSDRRGTAFGVFELSEQIGVSPWYFWADVHPDRRDALHVKPGRHVVGPPDVKYRGLFINDEDWGLQPWAAKTFDPQFGDIGPKTYAKVFELILRLRGNHLWPAMHHCTVEFGAVPENVKLADEWAVVMGAAHCEPLNRNNVWWKKDGKGEWRYDTNRTSMLSYWEEWARNRGDYEAVWTVGMRGIHDTGMAGPERVEDQVKLLERAIADQRELLARHVDPNVERVPQVFTPYKEALTHYQNGLTLPDDVTILWCEDNYGYIRQLSTPAERKRSGGSGVYYHVSYLGWPRPYLWLDTTPPALMWSEMTKAHAYGADRVWVLNVGDIKSCERGAEFWMRLAWDVDRYGPADAQDAFLREWAARDFGDAVADEVAAVMDEYYRLNFQRKTELMADDAFSPVHYREGERRLAAYEALLARAESIAERLPAHKRDGYYQLVLYPVRISALVTEAFVTADLSRLYARQGRVTANAYADRSRDAIRRAEAETAYYNNELAGGKWRHIMTAKGIAGDWNLRWPAGARVEPTAEPKLGVAVEGQGVPMVDESVLAKLDGTIIDVAATDGRVDKAFKLQEVNGATGLVVPNVAPGRMDGNTLTPGEGPKAAYRFEVPRDGEYNLFMYVHCPTNKDDSWFVRIDDGEWVAWNEVGTGQRWEWKRQGTHKLTAGTHTLTVANREDGAMFSRIRFTDRPAPERLVEVFPDSAPNQLPAFDRYNDQRCVVELYGTSNQPIAFTATPSADWIRLSESKGTVEGQARVGVSIDWSKVRKGEELRGTVTFAGAGTERVVEVIARNPDSAEAPAPFVESDGYVSIEAEHFTRSIPGAEQGGARWTVVEDLGRTGGAVTVLPVTAPSDADLQGNPALEYDVALLRDADAVELTVYCLPTHRIHAGRGLRYAVSVGDEKPQIVDFYEDGGHGGEQSPRWRDNVTRNAAVNLTRHGKLPARRNTIKVWMIDPGVVLDKLVLNTGGLQPSELGPPETAAGR